MRPARAPCPAPGAPAQLGPQVAAAGEGPFRRRLLGAAALGAVLAGCASIEAVEGERVLAGRLTVVVGPAWNRIRSTEDKQPYETWTQHGFTLDQLRLWPGIASGESLVAPRPLPPGGQRAPRVPTFRAGMSPDQLANLFEVLYAMDGSQVTLTRLDAERFAGERGLRLAFSVLRQRDDLQLSGVAWMAVRQDRLYALAYTAPRLAFFDRGRPQAEAVAASARIKA
jgi:hypothetical protein